MLIAIALMLLVLTNAAFALFVIREMKREKPRPEPIIINSEPSIPTATNNGITIFNGAVKSAHN